MRQDKPFTFEAYARLRRQQLAEAVGALCQERKWSRDQLANFLKCAPSRLATIEKGEDGYRLEEVEMLAVLFGIPAEQLTGLTPVLETLLHQALTAHATGQALAKCV